jgi:iron complex outermembrane receptor protein
MKKTIIILGIVSLNSWAHMGSERLDDIQVLDHNTGEQNLVDFIPSVTQIKGRELQRRRQVSVGETLQNEAGVSSTSYGPSASRPVIRGLDGDRIRVLQNGLGTLDASSQSLDHAIPVDMLTVDQIEVVRGPMGLLYGSSAVGGVVNLHTNRIHTEYEEGLFSQVLLQGETAFKGVSSGLHLNYGAKNWMLHADGSTRNFADQRLPQHVRGGSSEKKGKLPNSLNKQDNLAFGASHILSQGHFGASFNHFNTTYGTVVDEAVIIDMTQNRGEYTAEWRPEGSSVRKIRLRGAQSEYSHREIEDGETGTTFENKGNETRLEFLNASGPTEGVVGVQTQIFKFKANGDEAFLPTSDNLKLALFALQQRQVNEKNLLSFGSRAESANVMKRGSSNFGSGDSRSFLSLNGSLGHQYRFDQSNSLSSSFSYTERTPSFQELYALGDHLATGTFEEGESSLVKEKAYAYELSFKRATARTQLTLSAYTQVFKDYIALNATGLTLNSGLGLPEFRYEQVDALFYGADLEARRELAEWNKGTLSLFSTADFVRARDTDTGKELPRISPPRVSAGIDFNKDKWSADLEVQYVAHQTKTAPNERWTDSYSLTNVGYAYVITGEERSVSLFGRVRNLFDVEARNHVSTLKDIAPLPGRNLIVGLQAQL